MPTSRTLWSGRTWKVMRGEWIKLSSVRGGRSSFTCDLGDVVIRCGGGTGAGTGTDGGGHGAARCDRRDEPPGAHPTSPCPDVGRGGSPRRRASARPVRRQPRRRSGRDDRAVPGGGSQRGRARRPAGSWYRSMMPGTTNLRTAGRRSHGSEARNTSVSSSVAPSPSRRSGVVTSRYTGRSSTSAQFESWASSPNRSSTDPSTRSTIRSSNSPPSSGSRRATATPSTSGGRIGCTQYSTVRPASPATRSDRGVDDVDAVSGQLAEVPLDRRCIPFGRLGAAERWEPLARPRSVLTAGQHERDLPLSEQGQSGGVPGGECGKHVALQHLQLCVGDRVPVHAAAAATSRRAG